MRRLALVTAMAALGAVLMAPGALADGHEAQVTVEHRINGTAAGAKMLGDPKALGKEATVDVYVDDVKLIDDFQFGDVVGPVGLPAGTYNVKVEVDGTGIFVIDEDVTVAAGDSVRLVARFGAGGGPVLAVRPG